MEFGRFPNKLRKYRRMAGLSQKKVARVLDLADTSIISRWERGSVLPGLIQVFKLSKLYDILPHALFSSLWNETIVESLNIINQQTSEEEIYL